MWGSDAACIQVKCSLITTVILERKMREWRPCGAKKEVPVKEKTGSSQREIETPRKTKSTLSLDLNFRVSIRYQQSEPTCLATQSCLTLRPPWTVACQALLSMGTLQARILEWVAILFSRESSQPRDQTWISCTGSQILYCWATKEAHIS